MENERQLTVKEFRDLSQLINQCAMSAIAQTNRTISSRRTPKGSGISEMSFNQLFDCYCNSDYAKNLPSNYIEYVKSQISIQLQGIMAPCFEDDNLRDLMIPVIFYSLVVRHESKDQTVSRRINKLHELKTTQKTEPDWKRSDPFQEQKNEYYLDLKKEGSFDEKFTAQKALMKKCGYYDNPLISQTLKLATSLCEDLYGHLHYLEYFNDTARMGSFLCDILKIPENKNHNLNTILRMTVINSFQHILHGCSFITTKSKEEYKGKKKIPDFSDVLMGYVVSKTGRPYYRDDMVYPVPIFYIGDEHEPDIIGFLRDSTNKKDIFSRLYTYLTKNFQFDTPDFIDTFLDKELIKPFISCEKNLLDFMSANTKLMQLLSEIYTITAEMNNITTVLNFISGNKCGLQWLMDINNGMEDIHEDEIFEFECDAIMGKQWDEYFDLDNGILPEEKSNNPDDPFKKMGDALMKFAELLNQNGNLE